MSSAGSDQEVPWLVLVCPSCQSRCRAWAAPKGKAIRCPRCGTVFRLPPSQSISSEPGRSSRSKQSARPASIEESKDIPYAARAPESVRSVDVPEPDEFEDVEVRRQRPPAPIAPLWWGVYGFPWHPTTLRAWFLFGLGLSLVALMGGALHYALDLYLATDLGRGGIWVRVAILYIQGFVLFLLWTGTYAGSFFLATIQETAVGNAQVRWPDNSLWEKFFSFFYLIWIFFCSAIPFGMAVSPLRPLWGFGVYGWGLVASTMLAFPIVLLCALANNSLWMLWNTDVLFNLLRRPHVLLILYLMSALLLGPCVALGYLTIVDYERFLFLAPITGYVWSACLLIYGRLLGRVAWIISGEQELAKHDIRRLRKQKRLPTS